MQQRRDASLTDCWREAGRPGPGTCEALAEHIVCRNCPGYARAADRLLDRPAPPDYVRQWTEHVAIAPPQITHATEPVLIFRLGSEWLALPIAVVEHVTARSPIHVLPHRRLPVRGLVRTRGELVVCISLEALLNLHAAAPAAEAASRTYERLVVLGSGDGRVAFEPADVHGVHRYAPSDVAAAPATLAGASAAPFTVGLFHWSGRTVGCLDAGRVLAAAKRSLS